MIEPDIPMFLFSTFAYSRPISESIRMTKGYCLPIFNVICALVWEELSHDERFGSSPSFLFQYQFCPARPGRYLVITGYALDYF